MSSCEAKNINLLFPRDKKKKINFNHVIHVSLSPTLKWYWYILYVKGGEIEPFLGPLFRFASLSQKSFFYMEFHIIEWTILNMFIQ
jgi:hypothetical protein